MSFLETLLRSTIPGQAYTNAQMQQNQLDYTNGLGPQALLQLAQAKNLISEANTNNIFSGGDQSQGLMNLAGPYNAFQIPNTLNGQVNAPNLASLGQAQSYNPSGINWNDGGDDNGIIWNSSKPSGVPASGTAGEMTNGTPLSIQNNNPGNMRDASGNFQQFSDPAQGLAAMQNDLSLKINGKSPAMAAKFGADYKPTLANVISTWAPPEDGNDTASYIKNVAQQTGLDPNKVLSQEDIQKIMPAMIAQEGGQKAQQYFNGTAPVAAAQTSPNTAKVPSDLISQTTQSYFQRPDLNWDYLNKLPQQAQDLVKGVASGSIDLSTRSFGRALNTQLIAAASQFDPTFSTATAKARTDTLKSLAAGGKTSENIKSLNTFLEHFADYGKALNNLDNSNANVPGVGAYNYLSNMVPTKNNQLNNKVLHESSGIAATELAKTLKGSEPAEGEVKRWANIFDDPAMTPDTQNALLQDVSSKVGARMDAISESIKQGLGVDNGVFSLLSPKAKAALEAVNSGDVSAFNSIKQEPTKNSPSSSGWGIVKVK